ncbi:MAG: O-antigen ligase family protein [Gammaproteobacteria bacterium]
MSTTHRSHSRLLLSGTLFVVCLAPLPLGGNRPLPWSFNAVMVGALLTIWLLIILRGRTVPAFPWTRLRVPAWLFSAAALWIVAQALPLWPASWSAALPLVLPSLGLNAEISSTLSAHADESRVVLMRLLTNAGVFLLAVHLGRDSTAAGRMLRFISASIGIYAVYGLVMHLGGVDRVLWWERWAYRESVTGTFVNRNHFATLTGLGWLISLTLLNQVWRQEYADRSHERLRSALIFLERNWIWAAIALIQLTALGLSLSRAGLMATLIASVVLTTLLFGVKGRGGLPTLFLVLAAAGALLFGGNTLNRLEANPFQLEGRAQAFESTIIAIQAAPLTGHGAGSFEDVFRHYRPPEMRSGKTWDHAHNDYLEMIFELGLPASAALLGAQAWILVQLILGLKRRRRGTALPALGIASVTLVGLHALLDFSIQMPGVALPFFALLGLSFAQAWPGSHARDHRPR